ncbi:MAG: type VI secretion system ATPase TssH, partial [Candidatus Woesearchaeota archaeon]
ETRKEVETLLLKFFRPEFINRIDQIVVFRPLDKSVMEKIAEKELSKIRKILSRQGIDLAYTNDVIAYFANKGYDPVFGARSLRRLLEEEVLDQVAILEIEGKLKKGKQLKLVLADGKLSLAL